MKIYTRYAATANDFIRLRGVVCFIWLVFPERPRGEHVRARRPRNSSLQKLLGEWAQALRATISGIVWVDKR